MAAKAHKYDKKIAEQIELLTAVGIPQDGIAYVVGITSRTIRKYYRKELDSGKFKVDAAVAGKLVKKALGGCTVSQIFYLKTRCQWAEKTVMEHDVAPSLRVTVGKLDDK